MKRSEIEQAIAEKFNLESKQAEQILDTITEYMTEVLQNEERIEIRGFGSLFTKSYDSYTGRNPRTGEKVKVPPKKLPHFRPSKLLTEDLNED